MRIEAIAIGNNPPEDVNVIIEVPVGGEPIKYEMDKEAGTLFVDRFLHTSMRYPGNYGFVPHTLSGDGDPIDVLVCNTRALVPGCVINVRPIGVLVMEDNAGEDEKIIAVPSPKLTQALRKGVQLHRPARDHARPGRALLRALQGSRARQMGQDRRLARRRARQADDRRGDRARQDGLSADRDSRQRSAGLNSPGGRTAGIGSPTSTRSSPPQAKLRACSSAILRAVSLALRIAGRQHQPDGAAVLLAELADLLDDQHLDLLVRIFGIADRPAVDGGERDRAVAVLGDPPFDLRAGRIEGGKALPGRRQIAAFGKP